MKHQKKNSEESSTAERFAALSRVGTALMSELDETRLLHMIANTACELTDASFAAFTLRPVDEMGQPLVPSEGHLFHLAAVVGVTKEQEELFRRMPLGGEGLLAPIFRHGVSVLVPDVLAFIHHTQDIPGASSQRQDPYDMARQAAFAYVHSGLPIEKLRSLGVPRGHPAVRSFLGVPVLDRKREVRGGLLLGHTEPGCFTHEDEALLVGLAAQAAVALENARLYRMAQMRAQELNAVFESIGDGISLVDHHGNVLRENSTARHLRELIENGCEGKDAIETLLYDAIINVFTRKTRQSIPVTLIDNQQEVHEYMVNVSPLHSLKTSSSTLLLDRDIENNTDEPVSRAVVVWHDVTETKQLLIERRERAETEARLSLLQALLDELPSSVCLVWGRDAQLVLANHAAQAFWGANWTPGQPMLDFLKEYNIRVFAMDGQPLVPEQLVTLRAVRKGETVRHYQEVIRHTDGTSLPTLVNAVALDAHELRLSSTNNKSVNATDEKELAALVVHQDLTALKETERLKDEFIGIAAHELRNPLAVLKGFAQTLILQTARKKGPELADWQLEALEGIDQATLRMVELIDDLLDVTRLQGGRLELHLEPTDMIALLQRVINRLQITTEQHTLSLLTPLDYLVVQIDPQRIEQVLNNLLSNAIKYSPEGGGIEITVHHESESHTALISICDHGIGIPVHQQARIFGRFVRADNARNQGIRGTGLGLYLSRELIERHGGRIWFESAEGKGSTFFIALPLQTTEDEEEG